MKKVILVSVIVTVLVVVGWFTVNKISENKAKEATRIAEEEERKKQEEQSSTKAPEILYLGKMVGEGENEAAGLVTILNLQDHNFISFNEDFKVSECSDATAYLGNDGAYDPETRIGIMTSNEKSQNYEIPQGLDINKYEEVWVVCQSTSKPLGHVKLVKNGNEEVK
jgi:hypothetical protein